MNNRYALLVGATGLIGNELLNLLAQNNSFNKVVVLTRREIPGFSDNTKVEQHIIDFENLDNYRDLIKADCIFCTLGTTIKKAGSQENFYKVDFNYPLEIAKIAKKNGAQHFLLVSSMGANPDSKIFYSRVKGEIEREIQKLNYRSASIFRPSLLIGERKDFRIQEEMGKIFDRIFSFAIPKKYKPVAGKTLAKAMIAAALYNEQGFNIYESDEIQEYL